MNDDLKNKVADIALELADDCQRVTLFDDVIPTLTQLRNGGIPYGLISNLATPYVEPVIKLLSAAELLPPPELCLWSCKEGVIKPDKVIFERFCERVKMSPSEVLVIGDNQRNDLFGARDVGCQARILLRGNRTKDESMSAEDCISGLDSVPRLLGLELAPQLEFRRNSRGQNLSP
jgi:FMN phosphatase YigB (HAD superfamily)